ncbi:hypothetical protein LCGC14_0542270 [marine sediment metagenome]|uniref:Uncharacterized protein n=1 Tax=marine sediment metagenome TaxID=412755 RepID=A0A0F9SAW0_9ZZZZ
MPVQSKAQFSLMKGIAEGSVKPRGNLTVAIAKEFISGQTEDQLPERAKKQSASERRKQKRQRK